MLAIKSPKTYHHQPGIRTQAGNLIAPMAKNILIITSPHAWDAVNPELALSLQEQGIRYDRQILTGECTHEAVKKHQQQARASQAELILGIGGGRVLDCAKAVGDGLQLPVITMPTIAATCAAWSPVSIIYDDAGGHLKSQPLQVMPLMVWVDSEVIAKSDVRYLKAGIIDALAKWYEFRAYLQKNGESLALNLKIHAARFALEAIQQYGLQAVADNAQHQITPALIRVIDANIAGAGLANSMRDDAPSPGVAHAIHNRLTHQPAVHHWLHGEKVGFSLLVQSLLEHQNQSTDAELLALLKQYDMPLILPTLSDDHAASVKQIAQSFKFPPASTALLPFSLDPAEIEFALLKTQDIASLPH